MTGPDQFDRLFTRGRDAVLSGTHVCDVPPVDGGRWGMSVVLVPDDVRTVLAATTAEALAVAGEDHWPTGRATVGAAELIRFRFTARRPVRRRLARAALRGGSA